MVSLARYFYRLLHRGNRCFGICQFELSEITFHWQWRHNFLHWSKRRTNFKLCCFYFAI